MVEEIIMPQCKHKDCTTILSIYNRYKYCFVHLREGLEADGIREENKLRLERKRRRKCYCEALQATSICPGDSFYTCEDCNI